jgi:DNA repair exonuclease SbcCD ATPase subunit
MGPPPMRDAIRRDAMVRMDSIEDRLSRIEARLAQMDGGRGGPGPRPEMTPDQREMMEKRMQEARGKMEEARRKFQQMQERIRELEAEVARLKKGT